MITDLELRRAHAPPAVFAPGVLSAPGPGTAAPGLGTAVPGPAPRHDLPSGEATPLELRLAIPVGQASPGPAEARRVARRVRAWGDALDAHVPGSQVWSLNRTDRTSVRLRPTLAAALEWAAEAMWLTGGALDVAHDGWPDAAAVPTAADLPEVVGVFGRGTRSEPDQSTHQDRGDGRWRIAPRWQLAGGAQRLPGEPPSRHTALFRRPGVVFDLDPIRRGWLADRALALLADAAGALVEVDGAFAIRVAAGDRCEIPVTDPFGLLDPLAIFRLEGPRPGIPAKFGLATAQAEDVASGIAQASVLAATAREADALARCALLLDPVAGLALLDRAGAFGAVLVTSRGRALTLPQTRLWLAA